MNEAAEAVNRRDLDLLLAHGRFLEEFFGRPELSIESDEPNDPNRRERPSHGLPHPPRRKRAPSEAARLMR
jgi:hypothetical protein